MARTESKLTVNKFNRCLITDETELSQSVGGTTDENNFDINKKGNRVRRLGIEFESGHVPVATVATAAAADDIAISHYRWEAVGPDSDKTFLVLQVGATLHFFDASVSTLSAAKKSFTVDMDTHRVSGNPTMENTLVAMASGKGTLFVTGVITKPFSVEYDPDTDTITDTDLNLSVRDFENQDTTFNPDATPSYPAGASDEFIYDLLNKGWHKKGVAFEGSTNTSKAVLEVYGEAEGSFPSKSSPFWRGIESNNFTRTAYKQFFGGNTNAVGGHFRVGAFKRGLQRVVRASAATSIASFASLDAPRLKDRPVAVEFFAGRVFWGWHDTLFFGQLQQNDILAARRCFQEADPTSEEISDLIATDGGELVIPEMGNFVALFAMEQSLFCFADNGVWQIGGQDGSGFAANSFQQKRISSIGISSARSLVDAEGIPVWWGDNGIHTLAPSEDKTSFLVIDLTLDKIQDFYDDINSLSKENAAGNYDPSTRQIIWTYSTAGSSTTDRYKFDKILKFDLKYQGFIPQEVVITDAADPYIVGVIRSPSTAIGVTQEVVTDAGVDVTDNSVTVTDPVSSSFDVANTIKYWVLELNGSNYDMGFSLFTDGAYLDWTDNDYFENSYLLTFEHLVEDPMTKIQAPYVYVYSKQTETAVAAAPDDVSCVLTHASGYISDTTAADLGGSTFTTGGENSTGFIKGEDGGLYYLVTSDHGSGGARVELQLLDASDGSLLFSRTRTEFDTDATAVGLDPTSSYDFSSLGAVGFAAVPNSPYFIMWGFAAPGGNQRNYAFIYYKVNSAGAVVIHGGYAARSDSLNFANDTLAVMGVGRWGEQTDDDYILIAYNHTDGPDQEPWVTRLPSINDSTAFTVVDVASTLNGDSLDLNAATGDWDDNFWAPHTTRNLPHRQKAFFLPDQRSIGGIYDGTYLFTYKDGDSMQFHIDNPANAANSTYLETVDSTYPNGAMFRAQLQENISTGLMEVVATTVDNASWVDETSTAVIPFDDEREDKNGTVDDNMDGYMAPNVQLGASGAASGVWMMQFPKVFYDETPDLDPTGSYLKVRTFTWNQVDAIATERDSAEGDTFDPVADMGIAGGSRFNNNPRMACMYFDETAGTVKVINHFRASADTLGDRFVVSTFGTLACTAGSGGGSASGFVIQTPSGLTMQPRWDWADNTKSNKFGTKQVVYKYRQPIFIDETFDFESGYPIVVTKNKVRGSGRALQLYFEAVSGKGVELVGWAAWFGKNARP